MSSKNSWSCWSCKAPVTMENRADADGNCPHCEAELDIESWPFPDGVAPVVERQPFGYVQGCAERFAGKIKYDRKNGYTIPVYTAPPELAELQALNADALSVNKTLNQQMNELQATIAQLTAENERLTRESE